MTRHLQLALLLALLTAIPATAQTAPIQAKQALVVIQHDGSEGDVRVNGVLILHFASDPKLGKGSLSDSLGLFSTFATNGPNVVTIEARPETGQTQATTTFIGMVATGSLDDFEKPPLFKETIEGSGKAEKTIVLKNVPQWAFLKAEPFTGNKDDVLAAVRALHKALVDHDAKTLTSVLKPMYDDLLAYMGEAAVGTLDEFSKQMADYARNPKVEPLPADLKAESGYGNRLFVVTSASGKPPIRAASKELGQEGKPKWLWEIGSYWIHRPDGWFVIRQ
ncbi:MAG: hypothetical protein ACXVZM_11230 [Terriglobales bacterium]